MKTDNNRQQPNAQKKLILPKHSQQDYSKQLMSSRVMR
ncbi:MAG: hypothetical protein QOH41_1300 [Blastocatellia bacterium]|jgi:hypothetical protein|nr:hypothetical protein [Blastocatellia bacterium]